MQIDILFLSFSWFLLFTTVLLILEGFTEGVNYCWAKNDGATIKERYEGIGKAFSAAGELWTINKAASSRVY